MLAGPAENKVSRPSKMGSGLSLGTQQHGARRSAFSCQPPPHPGLSVDQAAWDARRGQLSGLQSHFPRQHDREPDKGWVR